MRFSGPYMFLFLAFFFYLVFAIQGKEDTNELVVGSGSSVNVGRGGCDKKESVECREGNGGAEECF
ncbi:unnamed protein product, partial [Vitis vinifera]|uniref:Phytosulfokine-beta n=1 Tax=Vitis vinifera TaxID=29760 RepID=D7SW44_VITVI